MGKNNIDLEMKKGYPPSCNFQKTKRRITMKQENLLWNQLYNENGVNCKYFLDEVTDITKVMVKELIEENLNRELTDYIKSERYVHFKERKDYRNGYYQRKIVLTLGEIEVNVPRARNLRYKSKVIPAYKRFSSEFEEAVFSCFVNGVSTRNVKNITSAYISQQSVSNIFKKIDKLVYEFKTKRFEKKYKYLLLDGLWIGNKEPFKINKPILVVMGITEDNYQEIISFRVSDSESANCWIEVLEDIKSRGITEDDIELIVNDGAGGIKAAAEIVYPCAKQQLCFEHKIAGSLRTVSPKHRKEYSADCSNIWNGKSKSEIRSNLKEFDEKWSKIERRAVRKLKTNFDKTITYLDFNRKDWVLIRSTSRLERANKFFRQRTHYMGCFNGVKSVERIAFCIFWVYNEKGYHPKKKKVDQKEKKAAPHTPGEKKKKYIITQNT